MQVWLALAAIFGLAGLFLTHSLSGTLLFAVMGVVVLLVTAAPARWLDDKNRRNSTEKQRLFLDKARKEYEEEERKREGMKEAREALDKLPPR